MRKCGDTGSTIIGGRRAFGDAGEFRGVLRIFGCNDSQR